MTQIDIEHTIQKILDEMRPIIQADGGDIHFESYNDGIVSVRLHGACTHCPMSSFTLKLGIEQRLKERLPFIKSVVASTE